MSRNELSHVMLRFISIMFSIVCINQCSQCTQHVVYLVFSCPWEFKAGVPLLWLTDGFRAVTEPAIKVMNIFRLMWRFTDVLDVLGICLIKWTVSECNSCCAKQLTCVFAVELRWSFGLFLHGMKQRRLVLFSSFILCSCATSRLFTVCRC